jgi:hypothetical protein
VCSAKKMVKFVCKNGRGEEALSKHNSYGSAIMILWEGEESTKSSENCGVPKIRPLHWPFCPGLRPGLNGPAG